MYKLITFIVLCYSLLVLGCGRDTPTKEPVSEPAESKVTVQLDIPWGQQLFPSQPSTWQGVMANDSLNINGYTLSFISASGSFLPPYEDQKQRDSVARSYSLPYLKSLAVERYLEEKYDTLFTRTADTLTIFTPSKDWQIVNSDSQRYSLVHYFVDPDYYLLQASYQSGQSFLLFNGLSGRLDYLWGRPYLSPDSSALLVASNDQRAQYSANGLQYFTISGDSLSLQWELGLENWGPAAVQWIGTDTVLIKREYLTPVESDEVYITDVVRMVIKQQKVSL